MTLEEARMYCANALVGLEDIFPPKTHKLTLIARYIGGEYADADMMVTADTLPELKACIEKRMLAEMRAGLTRNDEPEYSI